MKLPIIKNLAEGYDIESLRKAEHALLGGNPLPMVVEGSDEGEHSPIYWAQ